jgi:hypothetical protein
MTSRLVQCGCGGIDPESRIKYDASASPQLELLPILGRVRNRSGSSFPKNAVHGDIVAR